MDKKTFMLKAMQVGEYKRKAFIISAFSLIQEAPDAWKADPYAYRIVPTPTGYFFVDPDNENQLTIIDNAKPSEPIFGIKETLKLNAGEVVNLNSNIETTYGRLIFNYIVLINNFNTKIPYVNERISPAAVEALIIDRLKDNPEKAEDRNDEDIYVDEYLRFCDSMLYIVAFTQLCVPAATYKTMTAAPGIVELKNKLLEENKDRLTDPAVVAKIDAELVKFDKEYLKGDLGEGFLIGGKPFNIVRKKLYGMTGAEVGLEEKIEVDLIQNSLSQGWDINKFPAMNNSLRAGSYNRGAETVKGGEAFKWLQRASSNINVTIDDCGSKLGIPITVTDLNLDKLIGFSIITTSGSIKVENKEAAKKYVGKTLMLRSPMFCKVEKTDFCHTCVGTNLSNNPTGISLAITQFGSVMMEINMSAGHSKGLLLSKMNYKEAIF